MPEEEDDLLAPTTFDGADDATETEAETPEVETEDTPDPEPVEKAEKMVPLAALQAERAEGRATKERLDRIEAMMSAQHAQNQPKQPDMYEDPDAWQNHVQKSLETKLESRALRTSRFLAEREFGKDVVDAAYGYFDQHPQESAALMDHPSPFHAAVEVYNRKKAVAEIGDDPTAWREQERQRIRAELQAEAAQSTPRPGYPATPSLAGQTNIGNRAAPAWSGPTSLDEILGGGS